MVTNASTAARRAAASSRFVGIEGLDENIRALGGARSEAGQRVREVFREAGDEIVKDAKPEVAEVSGRLKASVKSAPTSRQGRVKMGTPARVPYAGWWEFGGTILFPNRSSGRFTKASTRVRERTSLLGGTVTLTRRRVRVVHVTDRGFRSRVAGAGSGAVTATRAFEPEGRALYPAFQRALPRIREDMTGKVEDVFRREGLY